MRNLVRNAKPFYYAHYVRTDPIMTTDDPPVETGDYEPIYTTPTYAKASISMVKGASESRVFGLQTDYDAVITLFGGDLGLTEASVLWINETDTSNPYDYIVKKVAPNLNVTLVAIKQVKVSE